MFAFPENEVDLGKEFGLEGEKGDLERRGLTEKAQAQQRFMNTTQGDRSTMASESTRLTQGGMTQGGGYLQRSAAGSVAAGAH